MGHTIRSVIPEENGQWDEFVYAHPHASIYHHSAWKQVLQATYGHEPFYVVVEEGNSITGLYPFMQVKSRFTGTRMVSLPLTSFCSPLVPVPLLQEVVGFTRRNNPGAASLEMKTLDTSGLLPGFMQEQSNYVTHLLDLGPGEKALFDSFHTTSIRQRINRAMKNNVRLRMAESERDVQVFFNLHTAVRKKHGLPPHPYQFFRNMWTILYPRGLLLVPLLEYEGEVIAGAFTLKFKDMYHFEYSASDERHLNISPNQLLIWEIIKHACSEGATCFDFGRSSIFNHSLIEFKERWGAKRQALPYYYHPKRIDRQRKQLCPAIAHDGQPAVAEAPFTARRKAHLSPYKLVSVRKGFFFALVSICGLACDSDPWSSPFGQPKAVNFAAAKVCGGISGTPPRNRLISLPGQIIPPFRSGKQ